MESKLERVEVESLRSRDHDLAVDHTAGRQFVEEYLVKVRKISIERTQVPALDEHV